VAPLKERVKKLEERRASKSPRGYDPAQPEDEEEAREWMQQLLEEHIPGASEAQQREFLSLFVRCAPGDPVPVPIGYEYPRDHRADA
jgi:hypothetical protein